MYLKKITFSMPVEELTHRLVLVRMQDVDFSLRFLQAGLFPMNHFLINCHRLAYLNFALLTVSLEMRRLVTSHSLVSFQVTLVMPVLLVRDLLS